LLSATIVGLSMAVMLEAVRLRDDPAAHVGVWHDPGSGLHFMDVSHVDPDFSSALKKAKEHQQLGIYDIGRGETIDTTPETMHFLHMSNLSTPEATLDPKFYGTGIKGAEARRGGTKTTSLYPWDIDPTQIEQGLESKIPYRVSVPKSSMYRTVRETFEGFYNRRRAEREAFARKQAKEAAAFEAKQSAEMAQFKQTLDGLAHAMKPAGKLERPKGLASMFT